MVANPPDNMARITPAVFYDDPAAALEWLARAFGFAVRMSIPGPDGSVMHAELELEDGVVMIGPTAAMEEWRSPRSLGGAVTQGLYVYVADVDAHMTRARAAGAEIVADLEEKFYGDRVYVARDPEGHQWSFAQHVRDVDLDAMPPPG